MINDIFYPDDMGGSGRYLREICQGLVARGHHVHVITRRWKTEQPLFEVCDGIEVSRYVTDSRSMVSHILGTVKNTRALYRELSRKTQYDIINFHNPTASLGLIFSKSIGTAAKVYTFHSPWHKEYAIKTESSRSYLRGLQIFIRRFLEKIVIHQCPLAIVLSHFMEDQLRAIHKNRSITIELCPGGANIHRFRPSSDRMRVRTQLNLPSDKTVLLTVRGLTPRTGVENLIRAMGRIVKQNSDIYLVVGGGGILKDKLVELTRQLDLDHHIEFVGYIKDEHLVSYYQAADFFILPTKYLEGFGLVTTEALACGLPVLATPVGGTMEILNRFERKLLFEGTDADSMAALILQYAQMKAEEWDELSRRCRTFIEENYSWENSCQRTEEVFLSLMNEN